MTQYFRAAVYNRTEDMSAVIDSNGMFENIDKFKAYLIGKGINVIEASDSGQFLDGNISKIGPVADKLILRAHANGRLEGIVHEQNGVKYRAVKVGDKVYVPDRGKTVAPAVNNTNPGSFIKSYFKLKAERPDAIIFYRIGDFYEIFSPDAETVSIMLGLTLTNRDCGFDRIPMCGVPHHSVDDYVKKLIDCGFKVIVAEP